MLFQIGGSEFPERVPGLVLVTVLVDQELPRERGIRE